MSTYSLNDNVLRKNISSLFGLSDLTGDTGYLKSENAKNTVESFLRAGSLAAKNLSSSPKISGFLGGFSSIRLSKRKNLSEYKEELSNMILKDHEQYNKDIYNKFSESIKEDIIRNQNNYISSEFEASKRLLNKVSDLEQQYSNLAKNINAFKNDIFMRLPDKEKNKKGEDRYYSRITYFHLSVKNSPLEDLRDFIIDLAEDIGSSPTFDNLVNMSYMFLANSLYTNVINSCTNAVFGGSISPSQEISVTLNVTDILSGTLGAGVVRSNYLKVHDPKGAFRFDHKKGGNGILLLEILPSEYSNIEKFNLKKEDKSSAIIDSMVKNRLVESVLDVRELKNIMLVETYSDRKNQLKVTFKRSSLDGVSINGGAFIDKDRDYSEYKEVLVFKNKSGTPVKVERNELRLFANNNEDMIKNAETATTQPLYKGMVDGKEVIFSVTDLVTGKIKDSKGKKAKPKKIKPAGLSGLVSNWKPGKKK